eukprot:Hpha_TRINITY_DN12212_c0_g1::TRINITY_DN12212_c0_g1_i2::g.16868::m.16868
MRWQRTRPSSRACRRNSCPTPDPPYSMSLLEPRSMVLASRYPRQQLAEVAQRAQEAEQRMAEARRLEETNRARLEAASDIEREHQSKAAALEVSRRAMLAEQEEARKAAAAAAAAARREPSWPSVPPAVPPAPLPPPESARETRSDSRRSHPWRTFARILETSCGSGAALLGQNQVSAARRSPRAGCRFADQLDAAIRTEAAQVDALQAKELLQQRLSTTPRHLAESAPLPPPPDAVTTSPTPRGACRGANVSPRRRR